MNNSLRIFLFLSLLALIGMTVVGGGYLRDNALDSLLQLGEKNNTSVAQGYVAAVWKKYRDVIVPLAADPGKLKDNPQVTQFAQETLQYFQPMPTVRVNVYSASGLLLMTDNINPASKILNKPASPDAAFVTAKRTQQASQIIEDIALQGVEHGKLVQTLFPMRSENPANPVLEGTLELMYNISDPWDKLNTFKFMTTLAFIGLILSFMLMLAISTRKAEMIIAKQHEANQELTEAAAVAQAENQEKSQFLANISHELRTPLNAIIGFSDIIRNEVMPKVEEKKYHEYINDINTSGVHLLSLINDILDYSKAEAGKLALEVSEVNATKMIQNSMRLVLPRAEAANVKLVEQMPKEPVVIFTDGKKFKQVLLNLLSNAVKFTPTGGQVSVMAWQNIADDSYTFEVQDTGIGIAPKDISRAMSPFGQVDNTLKRKYEGTGLGLPLTKKFVELMGGKFNIESELNKGTKIIFSLPREFKGRDGQIVKQAS